MVHRTARHSDEQYGKYNGLGGHLEPFEDIAAGMLREIKEEASIDVTAMQFRGTVNWTGFGPNSESWIAVIFLITAFQGTPSLKNDEGSLEWVPVEDIMNLPIYEGDKYFLPLVFDKDPRPFHGYLKYDNETPLEWKVTRM